MNRRSLLAAMALSLLVGAAMPAFAENSGTQASASYAQAADSYSFPLGDIEIIALSDGTVPQDLHKLLTRTSPSEVDALLDRSFLANPVEASINVYLLRDGERRILVDTGSGSLFGPGFGGKLRDSLASVGVKPEDITDILITHIHTDHTGGLVDSGKPAFANATVHVGAPDLDFFLTPANAQRTGYDRRYFDEAEKTIGVLARAGKVKTFAENETILPGIAGNLHPGHTPGSAFFTVSNKGQSIVFVGDTIHVESVQFPKPTITIVYDVDPDQAAAVREKMFPSFADTRQLIAAPHLQVPGVGHIRAEGNGSYSWHPVEYRNRGGAAGQQSD